MTVIDGKFTAVVIHDVCVGRPEDGLQFFSSRGGATRNVLLP